MNKLNEERGNVLVTAILLLAVMMSLGFAVIVIGGHSDRASRASSASASRPSTSPRPRCRLRPSSSDACGTGPRHAPVPAHGCPGCRRRTPTSARCPAQIDEELQRRRARWTSTSVRHRRMAHARARRPRPGHGEPVRFWDDEIINPANSKYSSWARYDADGNRHVWVRSEAIVRGRKRAIVAWVRIEDSVINFPQYAVLAGKVGGKNSGGHGGRPLVNSTGSRSASRCAAARRLSRPPASTSTRPRARSSSLRVTTSSNYPTPVGARGPRRPAGARGRGARPTAPTTHGCPANPNGKIVVIENAGDCRYTNSAPAAPGASKCCNTPANPGLCIVKRGKVDFGGNIEFWGVVWNANLDNSSDPDMIETSGTAAIHGGALVDGDGGVYAGSSRGQHRLLRARVREHQRGRHRRRRPEHLARDRQPEASRGAR